MRARIGAYAMHARHDTRRTTASARAAFLARFEAEVDPEGVLTPAERERRAEAARKAYFARLAYQSARSRAKKKAAAVVRSAAAPEVTDRDGDHTPTATE